MSHLLHYRKLAPAVVLVSLLAACGGTASSTSPAGSSPAISAAPASPSAAAAKPSPAASANPAAASAKPAASQSAGAASAKPAASAQMAPDSAAALLPKPETPKLRMGNNAHEADSFAAEYANQLGLYKQYGITDVTSTYFDGDAKGRQALLAGQIDFMSGSPASALESLTTDTHILQVGMFITKSTDDLVTSAKVKTVADLKGKKIGISQFGSDAHASVLLSLKSLGLQQSDVTILQIGGDSQRQAALKAGSIDAAPVDSSEEAQMQQLGYNILVHLKDAPTHLARESIMVRSDFAQKNPNTVLDIVAADMAALQDMAADPNKAAEGYLKWIGTGDLAKAQTQINLYLPLAIRNMEGPADGWDNMKEVMTSANPKIANVNVKDAYTLDYVNKLKSLGFEKAIGVPDA
jgi:NitT/TauT family transport system substrate-binding protein